MGGGVTAECRNSEFCSLTDISGTDILHCEYKCGTVVVERAREGERRRMKHDPMELVVLAVLAEGAQYGYAITKEAAARSGGEVKLSPGVLYPMLALLEKQGLITSEWEEVRAERAVDGEGGTRGRRRKWYRLSPKGKKRLAQRVEAHRAHQRMMEAFVGKLGGERGNGGGEGVHG